MSGIEFIKNLKDDKNTKKALFDNLKRELYFNLEIFDVLDSKKCDDIHKCIKLLKTDFYDTISNSMIKIDAIKSPKSINLNEVIDKSRLTNKNFQRWSKYINTDIELIEKVYLKISVLKALSSVETTKRSDSFQYLKFLMLMLKKVL